MQLSRSDILTLVTIFLILVAVSLFAFRNFAVTREAGTEAARSLLDDKDESGNSRYTDLDGNELSLASFSGTVRVVNSWASWSPFSAQELRDLEVLANEFVSDDVSVIAINRGESGEYARAYLRTLGTFSALTFVLDRGDKFYASIQGYAMPETVIYDHDGNVVFHKRGHMMLSEMRTALTQALGTQ